jgi:hypothetical protein
VIDAGQTLKDCTLQPAFSAAEKGVQVTAAMHNTQDKHVPIFNTVNDDIFAHNRAAASGTEILIAGTSDMGETGKDKESVCDRIDYAVGHLDAAAFLGDVKPDFVKICFGDGRYTMRHLAGRRCEFGQKARSASFFHFLGKLLHGLLRNNTAFSTRKRGLGVIERKKKFRALPLPFFPQGKRLLHGILF